MSATDETYDLGLLEQSVAKWRQSEALRVVYGAIFGEMLSWARPGPVLDIGSGIGTIREFGGEVVTSDVAKTPYVDMAVNAYELEETGQPWGTITAMDVLHHLREPLRFFASAGKALQPGGRVVLMEPAATAFGVFFYRRFHHEPIVPERILPPFAFPPDSEAGDFANMGMAVGLFRNHAEAMRQELARMGLKVVTVRYRDFLAYPLTGGFSKPAMLPAWALRGLLAVEGILPQFLLRSLALRVLVVIEKRAEAE